MSNSLFNRAILGLVLLAGSAFFLNGCGGSSNGGGGGTPPVYPTAAITTTSSSMNAGASQTIMATVSNPSSTVGCSAFTVNTGTLGTPTLSGNSCSATYTAPPTISAVTTAIFNFTGGGASATNSVTVNPVAQSISLPATMNTLLNGTIDLNSSVVTASSSCTPSAVTWKVQSTDSNTQTVGTSALASYAANATDWGTISAGNAPTENKVGTYNVTATCGSASTQSLLTVSAGLPTVTSTNPSVLKPTGGTSIMTGANFSSNNSTTASQWQGTVYASSSGACPAVQPTLIGGTGWISATQISWGFTSSGLALGSYNLSVINYPTAAGNDGGWSCLANAYTVTASGMFQSATGDVAVSYDPETGILNLNQNGTHAAFSLAPKAGSILVTADAVYVPQPASIAKIDLAARTLSSVAMPGYVPVSLAEGAAGNVYASATLFADSKQGAIIRISSQGVVSKAAPADGITSLASSGSRLVWTSGSLVGKVSTVHVFDTNLEAEAAAFTISRQADTVMPLSGGKYALVFQGGSKEVSVLDLDSFKETGSVAFTAGILGFNGDRAALLDGTIGNVGIALDGSGNPKLAWSVYSKQPVEDLYDGFAVSTAKDGTDSLLVAHRSASGTLLPQARTVPNQQ